MSSDASITSRSPPWKGPARAMRGALCDAGIRARSGSATSTPTGLPRRPNHCTESARHPLWSSARTPAPSRRQLDQIHARPRSGRGRRHRKPWPPSWRCATTCCRPRRILRSPIRNANSTSCPTTVSSRSFSRALEFVRLRRPERRAGVPAGVTSGADKLCHKLVRQLHPRE